MYVFKKNTTQINTETAEKIREFHLKGYTEIASESSSDKQGSIVVWVSDSL